MGRPRIAEVIAARNAANPVPSTESVVPFPRGLTLDRAAEYSGLTVWMLRTLIWNRKLTATLHGKHYVILREDLDLYLTRKRDQARRERPKRRGAA